MVNDNALDLSSQPYNLEDSNIEEIISYLQQRLSIFYYMRTYLYLIEKKGGALVRPLSFDFNSVPPDYFGLSQIMFGNCLMGVIYTESVQTSVSAYFPATEESGSSVWMNINNFNIFEFSTSSTNPIQVSVGAGSSYVVPMF